MSLVTIGEDRHPFHEGDLMTFSDVCGMVELNGCDPRPVHVLGNSQFTIGDTSSFSPYEGYGWCTQVKQPRVMHFQSLEDANKCPGEFMVTDFGKFDHAASLHAAFLALDVFVEEAGRMPCPWSDADADELVKMAKEVTKEMEVGDRS